MQIDDSAYWFIFQDDRLIFINHQNKLTLPKTGSLGMLRQMLLRQHTLGNIQETIYFCGEVAKDIPRGDDIVAVSLRKAFEVLQPYEYGLAVRAVSIINWDRNHQFCGRCGNQTQHMPGHYERSCPICGLSFYPRISPSIIVLIHKNDQLLMARSPHFTPGAYGLIAGFVEIGESLEETIHREVKEEVNIEIKNLRYIASQPWPFPDSLMMGFTAEYAAGEIKIDGHEIEAAGWYRYDQLPGRPSTKLSLASRLIDQFIAEQSKKSNE